MMLLIFCDRASSRLHYLLHVLFTHLYRVSYEITENSQHFDEYTGAKISYSKKYREGALNITPSGLLSEKGIKDFKPNHKHENDRHYLFFNDQHGNLPYDPFSAMFYLISRYEEYLPFEPDNFGRFQAVNSIAGKYGFLSQAIVHQWADEIVALLRNKFTNFPIGRNDYKFEPTFDIDNCYAFINKPFYRKLGGTIRSLFSDQKEFFMRLRVYLGDQDPYDNYSYIREICGKHKAEPKYFILTADYGGIDNNIPLSHRAFVNLIQGLSKSGTVGLHPSYKSGSNSALLMQELINLQSVMPREIKCSRQHYLSFKLPETYTRLEKMGITDDYSMGYPEVSGFRAGISIPYPFYDLENERETNLIIHPSTFMEATYMYYQKLDPEGVKKQLQHVVSEVKQYGGVFIPIWHNESLSDKLAWKGWRAVFEYMFQIAAQD